MEVISRCRPMVKHHGLSNLCMDSTNLYKPSSKEHVI